MSQHTIRRIANVLEQRFAPHIDMSDWEGKPEAQRRIAFLSRALAALCIQMLGTADEATAAQSLTDGFGDHGLDAIRFDHTCDTLFFVQSKWSQEGKNPMNGGATAKFIDGVRAVLSERFERFNDRVRAKEPEIRAAFYAARDVKIVLISAHTAVQGLSSHAKHTIDDYLEELNKPIRLASAEHFDQARIYSLITSDSGVPQISLQILLRDWGNIAKPFAAYYGRVHLLEVVSWWHEHGRALCTRNLRQMIQSSEVNDALRHTIQEQPKHFWYFNNGVTIICDRLIKTLAGHPHREIGVFNCHGVSVVNGAQTVGVIGEALASANRAADSEDNSLDDAWVQVRIISLENGPVGFDRTITEATNFQNAVSKRDFAAMDPLQHRLAIEFALDRRRYIYKTGDDEPRGDEGCGIVEATQALGCAHSMELAVQVKREIGELWAKTDAPPYTDLFNEVTTSTMVWKAVLIMRAVDEELQRIRRLNTNMPRADTVGIHLNRVILNLVFRSPRIRPWRNDAHDEGSLVAWAQQATQELFPLVADYVQRVHPGEYLASLCKNREKCNRLAEALRRGPLDDESSGEQMDLF